MPSEEKLKLAQKEFPERVDFEKEEKPFFSSRFWPALFILGFLIFLVVVFLRLRSLLTPVATPQPTSWEDETTTRLQPQSSSDEISVIEADLEATDFSELDQELEEIETELATPDEQN